MRKEGDFGIRCGWGCNTLFSVTTPHKPRFRDQAPSFSEFGWMKVVVKADKGKGRVKEFKMPHYRDMRVSETDDLKQEVEWIERHSHTMITS